MKYIATREDGVMTFEDIHEHRAYATRLGITPTSAGFVVRKKDGRLECCGESISLGLKSDPRDTIRLNAFLREAM